MLLYLLADGEEFACQIMMLGTMNYLITPLDEGKVQYKAVQFFHTCENKAGLQGKKTVSFESVLLLAAGGRYQWQL